MSIAAPTFVHRLRERARTEPDRLAYVFLQNGEDESGRLTVGELDRRARAIAAALNPHPPAPSPKGEGESLQDSPRALLLYPPGLDFVAAFFGCLYAGVIAVPSYPPAPSRPGRGQPRLKAILEDCAPRFVLTTEALAPRIAALREELPGLAACEVIVTDSLPDALADSWQERNVGDIAPESIAFLQYTSGSTSDPKGVMVSHGNLVHNQEVIREACGHDERSTFVSWLPIYHDMGLIGGVLQPLWVGAACVLMAPVAFLQRPVRWLRAIAKWRARTSGAPDFAYDLCARKVTAEQMEGLDLSSWRVAFDGAEPVREQTLEAFAAAFGPAGFRTDAFFPCYGLAEATLIVSGRSRSQPPTVQDRRVGCGPPGLGLEIAIADPETGVEKRAGEEGEIWVAGGSVAQGYWNRPEQTEATFHARLANRPGTHFLRTGDLGFLHDGELFVTGRIKDLIIVRGRNHYPQDLEATAAASYPALRGGAGAAFSVEATGSESAALVQEIDPRRTAEATEALGALRQALAEEHEIPMSAVVLVKAGTVPKTTSGKVQRHLCRRLFEEGRLQQVAAWRTSTDDAIPETIDEPQDLTAWLQSQVAAKLGLRARDIDPTEPLARHGIDSLSAVELAHEIETTHRIDLPLSTLLESPSLETLVNAIRDRRGVSLPSNDHDGIDLTPGERALWFLQQLEPTSSAYHIAGAARIPADADLGAFHRTFQSLIDRHPALRTTFPERDGEPVRQVHEAAEVDFRLGEAGEDRVEDEIFRPFDLENGPLLRIRIYQEPDGERTLLLVIHHLIADFWSLAVMVGPPGHQCPGYEAAPSEAGLKPRSRGAADSPGIDARADAWAERLAPYPFILDLPTDHPRPVQPRHRASSVPFALDGEAADRLRALARERGTTLFAALLTIWQALLHRASGQERLLVGAPTSGRSRAALAGEVGYFVNTVVLPSQVDDDPTFETLLDRARRSVLDAFAQEVPFPTLVERLQPERDPGRTPLFQAAFVFQKAPRPEEEALAGFALNESGFRLAFGGDGGLVLESLALPVLPAQFDLTLVAAEVGGALRASLVYDLDLFEEATAVRMTEWLRNLAGALAAAPGRRAGDVLPWSPAERIQILHEWAGAEVPAVRPLIPERVAAQAAEAPEAPALRQGDRSVTYDELVRRAHGLAWRLRGLGVGPETMVAVFAGRRPETVIGLLAVLEAGGAYVPIDPSSPPERVARLVADSGARVLLTEQELAGLGEERDAAPPVRLVPGNLAYVIYTSGSTGLPKGVQISHESLRAFVEGHEERHGIGPADVVSHLSGQAFDVSVLDLWVPLANGACVWLPEDDEVRSAPDLLWEQMAAAGVTHACLTTSLYEAIVGLGPALQRPSRLRHLLAAGERMRQRPPAGLPFEVWNAYGPTEATVLATAGIVAPEGTAERPPSIGRPIAGTRVILLDRFGRPVPAGAPGELCLGGAGLARGYLGRPELTAEKFVPDPFGPPGSRLYRTGDLARWLSSGKLEFLRRIDAQVKIRGFRIEPGEIERTLVLHSDVRDAAVLPVEDPVAGLRLVAFVVPAGAAPGLRELREHLAATLPPFMIPSAFVTLDALPLTSNGKMDRRALATQAAVADPTGEPAAPRDPVEEALAELWAAELGRERVGIHDDFFALGGHSLLGARLVARIREAFGADLALRRLFATPTIAGLAEALRSADRAEAIRPAPRDPAPPASIAQESLWFLDRLQPGTATYNVPLELRWSGALSLPALAAALAAIEARHEALRTSFPEVDGRPVGCAVRTCAQRTPQIDLAELPLPLRESEADRIASMEAHRPFDLRNGPLSRITLVRLAATEHRLLWLVHHIVADGESLGIWFGELTELYQAALDGRPASLPALAIQPADVAVHERAALASGALEPQLDFWQRTLAGAPVLELPADHLRPAVPTPRGLLRSRELPGLAAAVSTLAREERATPFMVLLASFAAFLSRVADQEDLVVGTPVSHRGRAELQPLIGYLVDTVAVRISTAGEPVFRDLVGRTRRAALDAFLHADPPFEAVVERIHPERGLGRNPVFPVLFSLTPPLPARLELPGAVLEPRGLAADTAKLDLSLYLREEEGTLIADLEAALDLFEPATAERLLGAWAVLFESAVADPSLRLGELPLLGPAERAQLVTEWNGPIPSVSDRLEDLVHRQAERTPDAVAVIDRHESITYRELVERSAALADRLRNLGVGPETVVAVSLPRTADLIVALLGVLEAGAAYLPVDLAYPEERRRFMLEDGGATLVIQEPSPPAPLPQAGEGCRLPRIVQAQSPSNPLPSPACGRGAGGEGSLAYIIYTSGSTGRPKGVAVEHETAVRMVRWAAETYREVLGGVLFCSSVNFDPSVMEIFAPLSIGGTVIVVEDALALLTLPEGNQVTFIDTVPSALTALLEAGPLPPSVRVVGLAGEPLRRSLADRFYADGVIHGGPSRELWNLYGPTEDTVYSTAALVPAGETPEPLIGRPISGSQVYVADRRRVELLPAGVPGELFIGGGGIVRGYWRRPDLTAERFVPDPFSGTPGGRLYRTGDKARWRPDGQVEFLGRFDHQVKIRGFRIELGEVEAHLLAHRDVKTAAALALPGPGGALQLLAFAAPRPGAALTATALREHLAAHLPSWYLPASLTVMDVLPLTPSGKTDRRALTRMIEEGALALAAHSAPARGETAGPRNPVEELLVGLWCELLGLGTVGIHDDFFALGGHSLLATRIVARVRALLGVELPLQEFFEATTVADLAERIEELRRDGAVPEAPPIVHVPRSGDFPLSFAQRRLWFLRELDPESSAYHITGALRLRGALDPAALERALREIARRHEALRTTFGLDAGEPFQRIDPEPRLSLPVADLTALPDEIRQDEARRVAVQEGRRRFDLERGPLVRSVLLKLETDEHLLAFAFDHIIADGWSLGVLLREIGALYPAFAAGERPVLPELPVQGVDFAVWQRGHLQGETLERLLGWWKARLAGSEPVLALPTDRPRPAGALRRARTLRFRMPDELVAGLDARGRRQGATLFMTLLAGWASVLARWSGQSDLTLGSPVANRRRVEIEDVIGFFVNTLPLRVQVEGAEPFRDLLDRVRDETLAAYDHQDLPLERLVEELRPGRALSLAPLFQVLFALQNAPRPRLELPGLTLENVPVDLGTPKLDLALGLDRTDDGLLGTLELAEDLFDLATAERLERHWETLLTGAVATPEAPVGLLPLLTEDERSQLLAFGHPPAGPLAGSPLLHERFAAWARWTPGAPALRSEGVELTYRELEILSNRLAHHLVALGVEPGSRVGLGLERSVDAIVGILGILKAGAAWLPLDPAQPLERLASMALDSRLAALVTSGRFAGALGPLATALPPGTPLVPLDIDADAIAACSGESPGIDLPGEAIAYVLYTSGSTGRPKGVCCPHVGVANLMDDLLHLSPLPPGTVCSQWASLGFDVSVLEIFWTFETGGCLDIIPDRLRTDGRALAHWLAGRGAECIWLPPVLLADFAAALPEVDLRLLRLVSGGEAVPLGPLAAIADLHPEARLLDGYGPTEASIAVSFWALPGPLPPGPAREGFALIGRPMRNTQVHVLSPEGELAPVGVPGELHITGLGLAQGYLGRADLTADRFVPDPFVAEPGARMYRTGDLTRWTPTGDVAYLGRVDDQVKIRGVRIEPGEVAAVLREIPGVADAVVAAHRAPQGDLRLVAWIVPAARFEPDPASALREALRTRLPEPMIPSAFVALDAFPLTRNGKVDRAALPAPDWGRAFEDHVPPRTLVEEMIAELWSGLLGVEGIGVRDSFFDLGGHSLKAGQLVLRVRELFGVDLPVSTIFEGPTIEAMAVAVGRKLVEEADPEEVAKIMEEMT